MLKAVLRGRSAGGRAVAGAVRCGAVLLRQPDAVAEFRGVPGPAQGLNLTYGFSGYLPFGYVGLLRRWRLRVFYPVLHAAVPPLLAILGGGVAAALLGLLLTPLLRLQGRDFGLASLAASQALLQLISNPNLQSLTGGPYGVNLRDCGLCAAPDLCAGARHPGIDDGCGGVAAA